MEDQAPQTPLVEQLASRSAEAIRELQNRARAALTARREQMSRLESQIEQHLLSMEETLSEALDADEEAGRAVAQNQAELDRLREELSLAQNAWEAEREEEHKRIGQIQQQLDAREAELASRETALQQFEEQLSQREQSLESAQANQESAESLLVEHEATWASERDALESARNDAQQERDKLAHELLAAREQLARTDELEAAAHERDELKQKFELALADVQRFRATVADLEEELSRRPQGETVDSAEVTHLRAERDALAARVEELESRPSASTSDDSAQQIADLQRRFEMAVEDVRELKTKNAELESQLSQTSRAVTSSDDGASMDWEAQKRRLLASLEGESGEIDAEREQERASIQDTINMTDAVIAQKDREIQELRQQIANADSHAHDDSSPGEDAIESLVNADEIIQQHRERAAQLEQELEQKLRAAELELSVERAKLAREKAEIEEWRLEMESFQKEREAGEPAPAPGAPRRRWLSKLGLNGDDS